MIHDLMLHLKPLRISKGCLSQGYAGCARLPHSVTVTVVLDVTRTMVLTCVHDAAWPTHWSLLQSPLQDQMCELGIVIQGAAVHSLQP